MKKYILNLLARVLISPLFEVWTPSMLLIAWLLCLGNSIYICICLGGRISWYLFCSFFSSFLLWPLVTPLFQMIQSSSLLTLSISFIAQNTTIMSPLSCLSSSVVRPILLSLFIGEIFQAGYFLCCYPLYSSDLYDFFCSVMEPLNCCKFQSWVIQC